MTRTVAARARKSPGSTAVPGSASVSVGVPFGVSPFTHSGKTRRYNSQYRSLGLRAPRSHAFIMCIRPRRVASGSSAAAMNSRASRETSHLRDTRHRRNVAPSTCRMMSEPSAKLKASAPATAIAVLI
jgi:hypothetical protein